MRRRVLCLLSLLGAGPLAAQSLGPADVRRIDSVFAGFDGTNRPGCALGVARGGTPVYLRGYGMADLQNGVPISPKSIFHVASVSKQFAAFAVALLAEDGKLSLDDEVRRHVPELPDYGKKITIRHLIHHTSGIRDQWELLGLAGWRYPDDLFTQDDVLEIVRRQKELNFAPGDEQMYSNSGYTLIAIIVQRVSGKSLKDFSEERIFGPLGMSRTHVHDDHAMIVPGRTSAYQRTATGWKISIPVFDTHGATSLFSTVEDLLAWQRNFVTGKVGSRKLLAEAETSALLNDGKPANYGFGISTEVYRGARAFGHGGADAGYRADVVRFPEHQLDIAVTCNFAEATPNSYARAVADILLEGKLGPATVAAAPPPGSSVTIPAARLAEIAGVYKQPKSDQTLMFATRDGKLVLENFGATLDPLDPSRFTAFGIIVQFDGPTGQPPTGVRLLASGNVIDSMVRMAAFAPKRETLPEYVGDYWSDELRVGWRVAVEDSGLALFPFKHPKQKLIPAFQDAFLSQIFGTLRFTRTKGRVTGFRVSAGRVRNVEFVKGSNHP